MIGAKKISVALLCALPFFSWAQTSDLDNGITGHWEESYAPQKQDWQAYWIWNTDDGKEETKQHKVLFRKSFQLSEIPADAILKITASSLYKLYINGEYINRGPARSAPHHQSYDVLDIKSALQTGKNVIAVEAHYQQGENAYHLKGRGGFLAELSIGDQLISTDNTWKVAVDKTWNNEAPRINRFQLVVTDQVDLRNKEEGWNQLDFDDSKWSSAVGLQRNSGWPSAQKNAKPRAITTPWTNLEQRHIPYLIEQDVKATSLIDAEYVDSYFTSEEKWDRKVKLKRSVLSNIKTKNYLKGKGPLVLEVSDQPYLLVFDFGTLLNGMPKFDIEGEAGTKVEVVGIPYMVDDQFTCKVVDSRLVDEVILSGKREQWEAQYFKPTRYLAMVIHPQKNPVKIYDFSLHQIKYPFATDGDISSTTADWVKAYTEATEETIDVCTTDGYTDNYRERRQYAQTGYYGAMGNYWTFGDYALQAAKLVQVAQEAESNGLFPAYGPLLNNDFMVILDSDILWVRSLHNYLLYSGDQETVEMLIPAAQKLMNLLETYTNSDGLIDNPAYAYWLDHAKNDRRGANLNLNGHYIGALQDFAEILSWMGQEGGEKYIQQANKAKQAIQDKFWNEKKGLFADALIDGQQSNQFSEHAQAMVLTFGIATDQQAEKLIPQLLKKDELNYVKRENGMFMVTPAMSYFLHKGLANYGFIDESFELFRRRFDEMLAPEMNGTLWEEWWRDASGRFGKKGMIGRTRSDAQTESAFATALFAEYLVGIQPTKPGMTELVLAKTEASIEDISATIPTPLGMLKINWKVKGGVTSLEVEVPKGTTIKLDQKSLGSQVEINGKKQDNKENYVLLEEGKYQVSSSKEM
ncbi:family 78 glycoside hydrolase catalytic domain [Flammeovirga agarivorans]|uniref:Alpha-L-rhamnosidase n=1 Tax=Flammeovirga agarivorans TaxID=2726742 RepID=A0A7X8XW95_9BACT|nr:family 78 glycoside hydrolase catalytic domain [Flammeovirga agarivorans]NLR91865.1 hypothetical protein [Flammeovirga agarivorans]